MNLTPSQEREDELGSVGFAGGAIEAHLEGVTCDIRGTSTPPPSLTEAARRSLSPEGFEYLCRVANGMPLTPRIVAHMADFERTNPGASASLLRMSDEARARRAAVGQINEARRQREVTETRKRRDIRIGWTILLSCVAIVACILLALWWESR